MKDRPRALAVLLGVFLLGAFLGSSGAYYWSSKRTSPQISGVENNLPPPRGGRSRFPDLQLTAEQEEKFSAIMEESRSKLDALRMEQAPKIDAVRVETNRKILAILDEEQRRKFEDSIKDMDNRRFREPRDRRFGPPEPKRKAPSAPVSKQGGKDSSAETGKVRFYGPDYADRLY